MKTNSIIILVFLAILPYEPFIFRTMMEPKVFVPIWITLFLLIAYIGVDYKKYMRPIILCTNFFVLYITYRAAFNIEYFNASLVEVFMVFYTMVLVFSSSEQNIVNYLNRYWLRFVFFVSMMEILAWVFVNKSIIPYKYVQIGDNAYAYMNTFLGLAYEGAFFQRPSLWFAEPSYVGLFCGLNFFYIMGIPMKRASKVPLLVMIATAGSLSGSVTYWVGFPVCLLVWLMTNKIWRINKALLNSIIICAAIIAVVMSTTRWYAFDEMAFEFSTSYRERVARMSISADMAKTGTITQLLFGRGSGSIVKSSEIGGESNLLLKLLIEQGAILLICFIAILYHYTKHQPALFLYCIICSLFIVGMFTPWCILNLSLIKELYRKSIENKKIGTYRSLITDKNILYKIKQVA